MSESEFRTIVERIEIGARPEEMARAVLVQGERQSECARRMAVSRSAVSQAVGRVLDARETLPIGYERLTVILPAHEASIVKKWQARALEHLEDKR